MLDTEPEQQAPPRGSVDSSDPEHPPDIVTIIEPPSGWLSLNLAEVWRYRELLTLLIWRDVAGRYRQSIVGYGWAVIKPVVSMLIFTFIFGRVAGIRSDGSPYPLFTFSALLPWMYFAGALANSTGSVVSGGALLKKVYFPRLILPLSSIAVGLLELAIQFVALAILMVYYRFVPGWQIVFIPLFVLFAAATALSVGLWLTTLNAKYRDVGQALPFVTQAWMWLSPIVYSSNQVPTHLRAFYGLNPMVGVIEGFRWSLLGSTTPDWTMMVASAAMVAGLLFSGLYFFRRAEASFADVI